MNKKTPPGWGAFFKKLLKLDYNFSVCFLFSYFFFIGSGHFTSFPSTFTMSPGFLSLQALAMASAMCLAAKLVVLKPKPAMKVSAIRPVSNFFILNLLIITFGWY